MSADLAKIAAVYTVIGKATIDQPRLIKVRMSGVDVRQLYRNEILNLSHIDICYYPAIRSIGRDTKFTVPFFFLCTVTDFSDRILPIGVKFCMAVWPDLGQVFSYFGGDSPKDGRILGVNRAPYGRISFLLKHLLCSFVYGLHR